MSCDGNQGHIQTQRSTQKISSQVKETDLQDPGLAMGMDIALGVRDGDKHTYTLAQAGTNSTDLSLNAAPGPSMVSVSVEALGEGGQGN